MEVKKTTRKYDGFVSIDAIEYEHDGATHVREIAVKKNAVAALVYNTVTDKYIFTKQWRSGNQQDMIEVVAGTLEYGEDAKECMIREVMEEVGYKIDDINYAGSAYVSPGFTNECIEFFYCEVSEKLGNGGGLLAEGEFIEIIEMTREEVIKYKFNDMKTLLLTRNL